MSLSDSMFLFEIVVEEIQSFINYKDFSILTQFADLFSLHLKNPNDLDVSFPKRPRKKIKRKKVRDTKPKAKTPLVEPKVKVGQSILIPNNVGSLILNMRTYPLQLTLCPKSDPGYALGSTNIPWGSAFIDYLHNLIKNHDVPPVTVEGGYNVFDEISSKRMATIKMSIKLSCLKDKLTTQFRSLSEDNPQTFMYTGFNSNPTTILSTIKQKENNTNQDSTNQTDIIDETGIIKTIYSGGRKFKHTKKEKNKTTTPNISEPQKDVIIPKQTNLNRFTEIDDDSEFLEPKDVINERIIDLVKSDTDLEVNKQITVIRSKSYSSLEYESHLSTLNYIFGDRKGPYGNQVYYVGYFTVENDSGHPSKDTIKSSENKSEKSDPKGSEEIKEKFKFKLCDSECPMFKKGSKGKSFSESHLSLDLPADKASFITVTKCKQVECNAKKYREPPPPPDDRVLLDLTSLQKQCCEKVEKVVGGMKAKMTIDKNSKDPCYCSCECTFGFEKRTTYCNICGGYELVGDELSRIPGINMPFPCPVFHKLVDKNKGKPVSATGSDTKKRSEDKKKTGVESEKESKKGKKKKKDDRFKFNYGYQGIPPQIGHSQCAMPCTGTLSNVPKRMGWLWTAEDVPGLKVAKGWRPGAITRRLLRKLNQAKLRRNAAEDSKYPLKKAKKRPDNKPTLMICKVKGEYIVEMQVTGENSEGTVEQYNPLVYRIAKANNEEKVAKLERKRRRLMREAVGDVLRDAYRPDVCERTCLRAYKQAVGLLPFDPNNPECICDEEDAPAPEPSPSCSCGDDDISSDCSSMDIDWEIHFTPPYHSNS